MLTSTCALTSFGSAGDSAPGARGADQLMPHAPRSSKQRNPILGLMCEFAFSWSLVFCMAERIKPQHLSGHSRIGVTT